MKLHIIQFWHFQTFQFFKCQFLSINHWLIDWFYCASKTSKMNQIKWFFNLIYKQNLRTNGQTDQRQEKRTAWHAAVAKNARPAGVIRSLKPFFEQAGRHASQREHYTKTIKIAFALCQFAPLGHWQLSCDRELSNPREKRQFSIQWVSKVLLVPEEKKPLWVHVWWGRNSRVEDGFEKLDKVGSYETAGEQVNPNEHWGVEYSHSFQNSRLETSAETGI